MPEKFKPMTDHNQNFSISSLGRVFFGGEPMQLKANPLRVEFDIDGITSLVTVRDLMLFYWPEIVNPTLIDQRLLLFNESKTLISDRPKTEKSRKDLILEQIHAVTGITPKEVLERHYNYTGKQTIISKELFLLFGDLYFTTAQMAVMLGVESDTVRIILKNGKERIEFDPVFRKIHNQISINLTRLTHERCN